MLHDLYFATLQYRVASDALFEIIERLGTAYLRPIERERDLPPRFVSTYRAGSRSSQKIRSVAARQNARLFGYYVSAYRENPVTRSGGSRMTTRSSGDEGRMREDVNIFILLYPCNSRVLVTNVSAWSSLPRDSRAKVCISTSVFYINNSIMNNHNLIIFATTIFLSLSPFLLI